MLYYYNNNWYSYNELYENFGITAQPANPCTFYDLNLTEYPGWEYESNVWIIRDNHWYPINELPYYKKLDDTLDIYLIDQLIPLDQYGLRDTILAAYDDQLNTYNYFHQNYGITETPSRIHYIKDGIIKCWYNQDINLFWDVDTKQWLEIAPTYSDDTTGAGNINQIGATGMFLYMGNDTPSYGTFVAGSLLQPITVTFPSSGELNYTRINTHTITGTWRILSDVVKSESIVLAKKVSDDSSLITNSDNMNLGSNITSIQYDF